jgi:hypothetical protein
VPAGEAEAGSQGSGVVKPTREVHPPPPRRDGPLQSIFEAVEVEALAQDAWRDDDVSGLPSAEDVPMEADAGGVAEEVEEEASQVPGKTTEVAEGGELMRHFCVPCGRAPGGGATPSDPLEQEGGATPSDPPEHEEEASTPVRSAAAGAPDSEDHDDDNDMEICEDDDDMFPFLEDEENVSEEEQQRKLEMARARYSEAINTLQKAYPKAQEFIDRLNEIGLSTEGLLEEGEVASAMDAEVTSTVIVQ